MPAIRHALLDRDGTVIRDRHYLRDPKGVELLPGAGEALGRLARAGVDLAVVTNQSGIGRGYFAEADYLACQRRLEELLAAHGVQLAASAFCPHAPEAGCDCRKPATGMWRQLREALDLDPTAAVMIGDKREDVAFARAAGLAASILVRTGHGEEHAAKLGLPPLEGASMLLPAPAPGWPTAQARDLAAAVDLIFQWNEEAGA